jgi:hypothetical protein
MIKVSGARENGQRFVLLGLSDDNVKRLREGKPIHVFGAELGADHDIIIAWGPTEDAIAADLSKLFGIQPKQQVKQ